MLHNKSSPNFNQRAEGQGASMLVLHYTGMESGAAALERLCDPAAEVSAHYLIEEDGTAYQLVEDEARAWHAGVAYWRGVEDVNTASIGIEIVNPGHEHGYCEFPAAQMERVAALCVDLIAQYNIAPDMVLGHSDVAIGRKVDPGHLFPWQDLAQQGVGLWPAPEEMDLEAAEELLGNQDAVHALLIAFGYDPRADFAEVVLAYHRHFCPGKFACWDDQAIALDIESIAGLLSLIRVSNSYKV